MPEVAARHAADPSLTEVTVAYYLSDGTTARASYPNPSEGTDFVEAIERLIIEKKRTGKLLAVDSLDIASGGAAERFIVPGAVVAVVIE